MENKRFEQTTEKAQNRTPARGFDGNYKASEKRAEELQTISPVFRKLPRKPEEIAPARWGAFSRDLSRQLEDANAPYWQTLRDKMTSTDSRLTHWFWIILALLLLAAAAIIAAFSLNDTTIAVAAVQQVQVLAASVT